MFPPVPPPKRRRTRPLPPGRVVTGYDGHYLFGPQEKHAGHLFETGDYITHESPDPGVRWMFTQRVRCIVCDEWFPYTSAEFWMTEANHEQIVLCCDLIIQTRARLLEARKFLWSKRP